jgi:ADP-ribosylation factor-like protein 3
LLLGLDNAGKTTILKAISNETIKQIAPTKGFNVKVYEKDNLKFTFWDLGGQEAIRHVWQNYYENNDAIVFYINPVQVYVIDSSDTYRLEETGSELRLILEVQFLNNLKEANLTGLPLLILANKQDLNLSLGAEEIMESLNLNEIKDRKWTIVACSALTKLGITDGLTWLADNLN